MLDLSVSELLRNLKEELDLQKLQKSDDLLRAPFNTGLAPVSKTQSSVRCRLGPRVNRQDVLVTCDRAGEELWGAIFMCNRRTWKECLGKCLFGLPIGKKSLVEKVVPGMKLFLFEYERRQLWGVFEAISYGGMNIIPDAYTGGSFPCQVRVKVPEDCIALNEEEFYNALKDNYFSTDKFHFNLTRKQVCHLTSLFERKYLRAKGMEPALIEYEDTRCLEDRYNPIGPLLLTNEEARHYPEGRNVTSLPHNLYASACQIVHDGYCEEEVGFMYRSVEKFSSEIGPRTMETSSLVPLSKKIVQNDYPPLNVDVSRFANIEGQLSEKHCFFGCTLFKHGMTTHNCNVGDFCTRDLTPVYSTLPETLETVIIPGRVSRLHSDRPDGKSVWARISGRAKPLMAAEIPQTQGQISPSLVQPLPAKPMLMEIVSSPMQDDSDANVTAEATEAIEEFSVGFKRRRVTSNNASANANEPQTSKRRRKLTRPFFEVSADESLAENTACDPTKLDLNMPLELQEAFLNTDEQNDDTLDGKIETHGFIHLNHQIEDHKDVGLLLPKPLLCDLDLSLSSEPADSSRPKTQNIFPGLPMKEVFGVSGPPSLLDEEQRVAATSHNFMQEAPLKVDAASLQDVKIQLEKEISKHVSDDSVKAENGNEATVLDTSNGVSSETISLDSTSGSALLNSVDLKSILRGLQVSGIKLQLGSSPCLILQLGDSSSSVGNQGPEGETQARPESSPKGPSGEVLLQRPSSG